MPWISNHKHEIEEKSTKISQSSSKVVYLGLADMWQFPTLLNTPSEDFLHDYSGVPNIVKLVWPFRQWEKFPVVLLFVHVVVNNAI